MATTCAPWLSCINAGAGVRTCRVGLSFPGIEVRFSSLTAEAVVPRGSSGISTLWTTTLSAFKVRRC